MIFLFYELPSFTYKTSTVGTSPLVQWLRLSTPNARGLRLIPGQGLPGGSMVKNPPADAGDVGDMGLIPGSGRAPKEEMATHSNILAWRIPWTEEPGGLQSIGLQ